MKFLQVMSVAMLGSLFMVDVQASHEAGEREPAMQQIDGNQERKEGDIVDRLLDTLREHRETLTEHARAMHESVIKFQIERVQDMYSRLNRTNFAKYKESLKAVGFDLEKFTELLSAIQGYRNLPADVLAERIAEMQKNLRIPDKLQLSKDALEFLQNNQGMIIQHLKELTTLLKDTISLKINFEFRMLTIGPRLIAGAYSAVLPQVKILVENLQSFSVKSLVDSVLQSAFVTAVANTATTAIVYHPEVLSVKPRIQIYQNPAIALQIVNDAMQTTQATVSYLKNVATTALGYIPAPVKSFASNIPLVRGGQAVYDFFQ